jgi:histone H4
MAPTGRGKGGKGFGKGAKLRHRTEKDYISRITKPSIRRLARRGGVRRISAGIYPQARNYLKAFLDETVRHAVTYTDHAHRKTITSVDVVLALKRQGRVLYGFGI